MYEALIFVGSLQQDTDSSADESDYVSSINNRGVSDSRGYAGAKSGESRQQVTNNNRGVSQEHVMAYSEI